MTDDIASPFVITIFKVRSIKMKTQICCALLLCLGASNAFSKDSTKVLSPQVLVAEPAHLTTRIEWAKFPHVQYQQEDLKEKDRQAIVRVKADDKGRVLEAKIQDSTGVAKLDQQLIKAVMAAKTKPFKKDGLNQTVVGYQSFSFRINASNPYKSCEVSAQSKNWTKQQNDQSLSFEYLKEPRIELAQDLLRNQNRVVKVKFKVNKLGNVQDVQLKKLSGVNAIDQAVLQHIRQQKVSLHRSIKTLWIYKKSTLTDEFSFKLQDCS